MSATECVRFSVDDFRALARWRRQNPAAALSVYNVELRDASCADLDLGDAWLQTVAFRNCNLMGANFESARLLDVDFRDSDMSGAKMPAEWRGFENQLKYIEDVSKSAQQAFFVLIGLLAYISVTILSVKDGDLLGSSMLILLPVIQKTLAAKPFYSIALGIAVVIYLYALMMLDTMLNAAARLPRVFPDGRSAGLAVPPTLFTRMLDSHSFGSALIGGLFVLSVPTVAVVGIWRVAGIRDQSLSISAFVLLVLSSLVAVFSYSRVWLVRNSPKKNLRIWVALAIVGFVWSLAGLWLVVGLRGALWPLNMRRQNLAAVDLRGRHLENADFTGADLTAADLSGAFLVNSDFRSAILTNADLENAELTGARLEHAVLGGAKLNHSTLANCRFEQANLDRAFLVDSDLTNADLSSASCVGTRFRMANLTGTRLKYANLDYADLTGASAKAECNFAGATLRHARMDREDEVGTVLPGADFTECDLSGIMVIGADLSETRFCSAILDNAQLTDTRFNGADLSGARLAAAHLSNVTLARGTRQTNLSKALMDGVVVDALCDFTDAFLPQVRARNAQLRGATLKGVDLHSSVLTGTTFHGVNLSFAKLQTSDLGAADLSGISTNLSNSVLLGARLSGTTLGDGNFEGAVVDSPDWLRALKHLADPPKDVALFYDQWDVKQIDLRGEVVSILKRRKK